MDKTSVKLVGFWVSPFVHRVRWALKLKGIEYEYVEEDIYNKTPLLSQLNPLYGKVPVLVHDGKPVLESFLILEYIDELWVNNPLLSQNPHERAQARFWAKFSEEKLLNPAWLALCSEGELQDKSVKSARDALEKIEDKIKGKRFFGGETIGYLDLIIGFVSYLLPVWEEIASVKIIDPLEFPALTAWMSSFLDHSAIKESYMPSKSDIFSYFKWRRKELIPFFASSH